MITLSISGRISKLDVGSQEKRWKFKFELLSLSWTFYFRDICNVCKDDHFWIQNTANTSDTCILNKLISEKWYLAWLMHTKIIVHYMFVLFVLWHDCSVYWCMLAVVYLIKNWIEVNNYTLFQLQTGNMVWYTLSVFYIPWAEGEYSYYLSGAERIFAHGPVPFGTCICSTCWDQRHLISIRHYTSLWHYTWTWHYYWIWHLTKYWFP